MNDFDIIWNKIFKKDVLLVPQENLKNIFNLKKLISFLEKCQNNDGSFYFKSPMIYDTYVCCGILKSLNKSLSKDTIEYVKSLQVGTLGFSETIGEVPWIEKSLYTTEIFYWFNLKPFLKEKLIEYLQKFQYTDGGFGSPTYDESNIEDTYFIINILYYLGSKPKDLKGAISYIKSIFNFYSIISIYNYIDLLLKLNYHFSEHEKKNLISKIKFFCTYLQKNKINSFFDWYLCLSSLKNLGEEISEFSYLKKIIENFIKRNNFENPFELFYAVKLYELFSSIKKFEKVLINYIKSKKCDCGGFSPTTTSILANNFIYNSLYLLKQTGKIDEKAFIKWLIKNSNYNGWGTIPKSETSIIYTTNSLLSLRLFGLNPDKITIRENVLEYTNMVLEEILSTNSRNNYIALRWIQNIIEIWMILNYSPKKLYNIIKKIFEFKNKDGGFGGKDFSYVYATFWAIRTLYLIDQYLKFNKKSEINLRNISNTAQWILSCQNKDGGFGPEPNQPSTMQSTFLSLYTLWMLKCKPRNVNSSIRWLLKCLNTDGGIKGNPESRISELLFSLYFIGSLNILAQFIKE